jgi:dihydrofolate reductase
MGKTTTGAAAVSLYEFIADQNDSAGPLFDWLGGDVSSSLPGSDRAARSSHASADFMTSHYADMAANVIGRRLFDLTNGWDGKPAAGEHVFVVTHQPPSDWEYAGTAPFAFVDGIEKAIAAAKEFAGERDVDVAAGQIGSQASKLGLIDQAVVNLVPGGLRLRPPVLRHRRPARAAAFGEPDHDRPRRARHPPRLRRERLRAMSRQRCTGGRTMTYRAAQALRPANPPLAE